MSDRQRQCPKCGSGMQAGVILDHTDFASAQAGTWVEGMPAKSFWTGLRIKDRQQLGVTTYRCERCGFLESYAAEGQ